MEAIENLLALARVRDPSSRARLLEAVVSLCEDHATAGRPLEPEARDTLDAIFQGVVADAERDIRKHLSDILAGAAWAPPGLINFLAVDDIDIAEPIITGSPVLQDDDLIRILAATLDHQIAVARRPELSEPLVGVILDAGDPAVLTALAGNDTARITPDAMQRLVNAAREISALRSPLARHPRMSAELATHLYEWVGQSLRTALASRFRIDEVALQAAIQTAAKQAVLPGWITIRPPFNPAADVDRNLVAKLHAAGQLRPSYLIRTLREGRLNLFIESLAALGGFEPRHIRQAIDSDRPELLALTCVAVGIDRSVFPAILQLVRNSNRGRPGGGEEGLRRASGAFGPFNGAAAGSAFKQAIGSVA